MLDKKLETFSNYTKKAFNEVITELVSDEFIPCENYKPNNLEKVVIVVAITGNIKGRVLFECDLDTAGKVAVDMNQGELLEEPNDLYVYMAEFGNMVCGRGITYLNNELKEQDISLSPPAIFFGSEFEILTPGIMSKTLFYTGKLGNFLVDIGLEEIN